MKDRLRQLFKEVSQKKVTPEEALQRVSALPFQDLSFAKVDTHREIRCGIPEVVFCPGKEPAQVVTILKHLYSQHGRILATRASPSLYRKVKRYFPKIRYNALARTLTLMGNKRPRMKKKGRGYESYVAIVTAGTADIPVAEEARETLHFAHVPVQTIYDIGIAGLHRLLNHLDRLRQSRVIIVIAGMEGALPGVVAGLVEKPVIAVPTSIGYGTNLGGIAPLLSMLNSCSAGVSVVNIDNGFGAAYVASLIYHSVPR